MRLETIRKPQILLFDIEATNLRSDFGFVLYVAYRWLGERVVHVITGAPEEGPFWNDKQCVRQFGRILADADLWVGWYTSRYDIPFLQTRILYHRLPPIPPRPHVDLWRVARYRCKLHSNRLANVAVFLGLSEKTPVKPDTWVKASCGHRPSLRYVRQHCIRDVETLTEAYLRLRALVVRHPNIGLVHPSGEDRCPACASERWRPTRSHFGPKRLWQLYMCAACGYAQARAK